MTELSKILNKYPTDKNTALLGSHYYSEIYDDLFKKYKDGRKVNILEIGVERGLDLFGINEYFNGNCEIYGIDINLSKCNINEPNIHLFEFDATDHNLLNEWYFRKNEDMYLSWWWPPVNFNKFDIIIDDGSHLSKDIFNTLLFFYNKLTDDGIYIIEDLHANYSESNYKESILYFLNFYNDIENVDLTNIKNNIKTCTLWHHFHNKNQLDKYDNSICAILTFK